MKKYTFIFLGLLMAAALFTSFTPKASAGPVFLRWCEYGGGHVYVGIQGGGAPAVYFQTDGNGNFVSITEAQAVDRCGPKLM